MKINYAFILFLIFASSCLDSNVQKSEVPLSGFSKAKYVYELAKNKNVDILFNVVVKPRGKNPIDSTNKVYIIAININNDVQLKLPVWSNNTSVSDADSFFIKNQSIYGKYFELPESELYDSIKNYSSSIVNLYNLLGVHEIISRPDLGKMIIFNIDNKTQIVYISDSTKIYHKFWKNYIMCDKRFDENWYYRLKSN